MKMPLLQTENRVRRTYRGGKRLDAFLGKSDPADSFYPEDWISSFVEAKNKIYVKGEGVSSVLIGGSPVSIKDAVSDHDFGEGRSAPGVLVKLLDAGERLGIQVHPTVEFSKRYFSSEYGKTECWYILGAAPDAAVYIGFKKGITREKWKSLFDAQDIEGMLSCLHRIKVEVGDTVLVRAGTPHAIGEGCFLLEIQEPTDYTMRVEKVTLAGEALTPMQIHYGVGEEALLDCFVYDGLTEDEARARYILNAKKGKSGFPERMLVDYDDTPCFALGELFGGSLIYPESFVSLVITESGDIEIGGIRYCVKRGDKLFIPFGCGSIRSLSARALVCYPPERR